MILAFFLFAFLVSPSSGSLTADPPHLTNIRMDPSYPVQILDEALPECLKLGSRRTTWQILWSCLATIFSCIWVAIHPNMPGPRDTGFQSFRRRITMAIIAIVGPEIIAIFATRQRLAAKGIKKEFNEKFNGGGVWCPLPDDHDVSLSEVVGKWFIYPYHVVGQWFTGRPSKSGKKWTLTHGFFVQMGGLMMYHKGEPVQVLTFDRMLKAIERGEIEVPNISEEEILDKSKGDGLSKLIVVLQTTWFITQCIGRWISRLPVTELEVLTLAFAILNAYIYALWWSKPQGALVPIKLEFKAPAPSPTFSTIDPVVPQNIRSKYFPNSSQPSLVRPPPPHIPGSLSSSDSLATCVNHTCSSPDSTSFLVRNESDRDEESGGPVIETEFDKGSSHWIRREISKLSPKSENLMKNFVIDFPVASSIIVLYPFLVAWKAMVSVDSNSASSSPGTKFDVGRSRVPMFYVDSDRDFGHPLFDLVPYFAIPVLFGGAHLALWSTPFTTWAEERLWQVSAVFIAVDPVVFMTLVALTGLLAELKMKIATNAAAVVSFAAAFLYPVARGILIIISLYALTYLPEDAYLDVQWTKLLPHISVLV